jgi:Rod binding domain-containing protein
MEISPLITSNMHTAGLDAEQVAGNASLSETEKVGELSRQFEALLLRQILSQGFKSVIKSSMTDDSVVSGIYQDMVTSQMADSVSQSGAFGLAQSLEKEMSRQIVQRAEVKKQL